MTNRITSPGTWETALGDPQLADALPRYIRERRWFGGKARRITAARIIDHVPLPADEPLAQICFVQLSYADGAPDTYVLPLAYATAERAAQIHSEVSHAVVMKLDADQDGLLFDAVYDEAFCQALLDAIAQRHTLRGASGAIVAEPTETFQRLRGTEPLTPRISKAEQSNSSIIFGDKLIMKLFRRAVEGENPDLEIGRALTNHGGFQQIAPVAGSISYQREGAQPVTLAMMLGFVANRGDAWAYFLELLGGLRDELQANVREAPPAAPLLEMLDTPVPPDVQHAFGDHVAASQLLGRRTAEMHLALSEITADPHFAPEPFTPDELQAERDAMTGLAEGVLSGVRSNVDQLPESVRGDVQRVLDHETDIRNRFEALVSQPLTATRTRTHGDYHLGQVLATGDDFIIIDFEGEPARSLEERRKKRSPLRDVAGMLRSFDYAAASVLTGDERLEPWDRAWVAWNSAAFLQAYLKTAEGASFVPRDRAELDTLLSAYLLEKAVYELQYELNNRPDWVRIPMRGILRLVS